MTISLPGTQEVCIPLYLTAFVCSIYQPARHGVCPQVLNDLLLKRGLTAWQVVRGIQVSTDSEQVVDVIYGNVVLSTLQDDRIERKRKRKTPNLSSNTQQSTYSCFIVLPAISCSSTLSIKRCVGFERFQRSATLDMM